MGLTDHLITYLQLIAIGFSLGVAGPCLLLCSPILITYAAGRRAPWRRALAEIAIFLTGRLLAYAILGILAGFSASLLGRFTESGITLYFKPLAGAISIILGILVLAGGRVTVNGSCGPPRTKPYDLIGLFMLGFAIGITPCAPLLAILFEIVLISENAASGMLYALSFGLGTFLSGFIVIGAAAGLLTWIPTKLMRSKRSSLVFRIICAFLLFSFGIWLILGSVNNQGLSALIKAR